MKTTTSLRIAIVAIAFSCFVFSCKKDSNNSAGTTATDLGTQADDQAQVSSENEALTNDINTSLAATVTTNGDGKISIISGGTTASNSINETNGTGSVNGDLICDATITYDTASSPRKITIVYGGTNCSGNRTRTGTVVISLASGIHWRDVGAVVNVSIQQLVITRLRDSKKITLNGIRTITNVSGGSLKYLANIGTITHTISDSMSITFADNAVRTWQTAKQRVFTYNNGIVITTTGTHSDGTNDGIAEWGTNRFGNSFTALITQPVVIRQDCDFRLVSGQVKIVRSDNLTSTITFGLDANGNATGCPGSGNYYLEMLWTASNGRSYPIILPY